MVCVRLHIQLCAGEVGGSFIGEAAFQDGKRLSLSAVIVARDDVTRLHHNPQQAGTQLGVRVEDLHRRTAFRVGEGSGRRLNVARADRSDSTYSQFLSLMLRFEDSVMKRE